MKLREQRYEKTISKVVVYFQLNFTSSLYDGGIGEGNREEITRENRGQGRSDVNGRHV
jgi:hypothetical protein